jgi:hypothetical protein
LNLVSAKAPKAPTIKDPAANKDNTGVQKGEKHSKVEAKVRAKTPKVAILTAMMINAVTGEALPS